MEENFYAFSTSFLTFFMAFIFGCGGCEMGVGALFLIFGVPCNIPVNLDQIPFRDQSSEKYFLSKGSVTVTLNGQQFTAKKGDSFFFPVQVKF